MKRLFAVVIVLAILVIGVGFARGWFTLSNPGAEGGSNKVNVNLTVDRDKMKEDAAAVQKQAAELTEGNADHPTGPAPLQPENSPSSAPTSSER
jgi:hypothetical protein